MAGGEPRNEVSAVYDVEVDPYDPFDQPVGIPLGDAMDRLLTHMKSAPADTLTGLRSSWVDIVGPQLSTVSRPVSLTDEETGNDFSDDYVSSYSSRGPSLFDHFVKPDLVAPGNRVVFPITGNAKLALDNPTRVVLDN